MKADSATTESINADPVKTVAVNALETKKGAVANGKVGRPLVMSAHFKTAIQAKLLVT